MSADVGRKPCKRNDSFFENAGKLCKRPTMMWIKCRWHLHSRNADGATPKPAAAMRNRRRNQPPSEDQANEIASELSFESNRGGRVDSLVGAWRDRHHRTHEMTERTLARPRALVIGGSVGGLFAAHLLRDIGWDVVVFERAASDLGDRGTGIGTREELFAVMRRIGLATDASIGIGVEGRVGLDRDGASSTNCRCAPSPAPGRASGGRCGRRGRTNATPAARHWSGSSRTTRTSARCSTMAHAPTAISWSEPTGCIPRSARSSFPNSRHAMPATWPGAAWSKRTRSRPNLAR